MTDTNQENAPHQMGFGGAVVALKQGLRVARAGWNGKGMFIYLKEGSSPVLSPSVASIDGISSRLFNLGDTGSTTRLPCLCMKVASGNQLEGWLASQSDMLADDWTIVK
jgi:hypothetical protein